MLLTKPFNGRCVFSLANFSISMSCVTDIPFDWLETCRFGLENHTAVSFILADYGNEYIVLLLCLRESRILKDVEGKTTVEKHEINLKDFTEYLLTDIKNDFEEWVDWYPAKILGGPDTGRKERLEILLIETEEALTDFKKRQERKSAEC